jgi:hypothetical protein
MVNSQTLGTLVVIGALLVVVAVVAVTFGPMLASAVHLFPGR